MRAAPPPSPPTIPPDLAPPTPAVDGATDIPVWPMPPPAPLASPATPSPRWSPGQSPSTSACYPAPPLMQWRQPCRSPHPQQQFHHKLIQLLIRLAAPAQCLPIKCRSLQRLRPLAGISPQQCARLSILRANLAQQPLNLAVLGKSLRLLLQDQVRPHAATRKRLH